MAKLTLTKALSTATCLLALSAQAQSVPPSAEPGRIPPPNAPTVRSNDLRPTAPQTVEPIALSPEEAARPIYVRSVTLVGATAISQSDIASYYAPIVNTTTTLGNVVAMVQRVRQDYMDKGYSLSHIALDPASLKTGELRINVLEAYVGTVDLDSSFDDTPILRSFVEEVKAMRPLNTRRLERLMLILNARPGLGMMAVLSSPKNGSKTPGEVTLTLRPRPLTSPSTYVMVDNDGSRFTGPFKVSLGTVIRNLGLNYDDLFISGSTTAQSKEMRQASLQYTLPILGASGALFSLMATTNYTEPGRRLAALEVKGDSQTVGATLSYPVIMQRDESWVLGAGLTAKNAQTNILAARLFNDRLRVVRVESNYANSDRWRGINQMDVALTKGMNGLGARPTGSADLSRIDGRSDFLKIEANISRLQNLGPSMDLVASARGQHTNDPLLSSEEFGVGGSGTGRGYDPSEITGDRGLSASLELRYNHNIPALNASVQPYGFYDVGKVWNIDPSDKNHASISSTGAGVRVATDSGWNLDAAATIPLTRPADEPPGYANGNSPRFLVSVKKSF